MNTQQTIEMARQHGTPVQEQNSDVEYLFSVDQIERLLAAEREACAKVCEQGLAIATSLSALDDMEMWGEKFAAAIRARSNI
jgi:hypothetical protein